MISANRPACLHPNEWKMVGYPVSMQFSVKIVSDLLMYPYAWIENNINIPRSNGFASLSPYTALWEILCHTACLKSSDVDRGQTPEDEDEDKTTRPRARTQSQCGGQFFLV